MNKKHILAYAVILFSINSYAQTRPSSTVSQAIVGGCPGCQINNPNNAWDINPLSYAELQVATANVGGYGEVVYEFSSTVTLYNSIKLQLQFGGGSILSGLAGVEVFDRIKIELLNAAGGVLSTYNNTNLASINVLSAASNIFEVSIINPKANTKRIRITSGRLVGAIARDLRVYDVYHLDNTLYPVTTATGSGKVNISSLLCLLCAINNPEYATSPTYDINSQYAALQIPVSLSLASGYLYSRYTWGTDVYSGNDYDIYLVMSNPHVASVGTELLFFDDSNLSIQVTYSDNTTQFFSSGSGLATVSLLGIGGEKFYVRLDANNSKDIKGVEVRFGGNLLNLLNELDLYTIFVAGNNPFTEPDIEAVYVTNPSKPVNDYTNANVLATATDGNGAITAAAVTSGSLPAGTSLATDGTITVSNASSLVAGTYNFQVTTTDIKGGTTTTPLTLTFNPTDIEAVYTVNPAKPVNDYVNSNILATVTDANGSITAATVTSGSLPAGTSLATNGTITVSNASSLVAGTYNFQVTTTDIKGGTTVSPITLTFNPTDIEAVYTINPAKPVIDYVNSNVLATVTDANGAITAATVTSGSLPAGTSLAADGTIIVSNASQLSDGVYNLQVTTTDVKGGTTASSIVLTINGADIEAVYSINLPKPVNDYANNDVVATVTDANGPITAATVTSGTLPAGTSIAADGTIKVSDKNALVAGTHNLQVTTTDNKGGTTVSPITLLFNATDIEAIYVVNPPKPVNDYSNNDALATVTDGNGPITAAVVTSGTLPLGTSIASDGTIKVSNKLLLLPGTYNIQVTTTDNKGGTTVSPVSIVLSPIDIEAVYIVNAAVSIGSYNTNDVLATAVDANGAITAATVVGGSLPAGTILDSDGKIKVSVPGSLIAGTYAIQIKTTDALGGTTESSIAIVIGLGVPTDIEAVYLVGLPRPVNDYANNDVVASALDANGAITAASVTGGSLPTGTSLSADGTIKVSNAGLLQAGIHNVEITTTDALGGTTVSPLIITFLASDIEAVYTVNPAKPINDYINNQVLATVTDANGPILLALVTGGNFPPATFIELDGTIKVLNASQLVVGNYTFQVTTTDASVGISITPVTIVINPIDIEAVYSIETPKPVNDYVNNDILATATDGNGAITSAIVTTGTLPLGTTLESNGNIKVSGATTAGNYTFQVTTTDVNGGTTVSPLTIVINPADIEAVYTIAAAKPVNDCIVNETIGTVTDANGPIISAVLSSGALPPGTSLDGTNGAIKVSNTTQLVAGTYNFQVTTTDDKNGQTTSAISITVNPADVEAVYTVNPAKPVNDYTNATVLASATDANGAIASATLTSGTLPPGTILDANGTVRVTDATQLVAGTYTIRVTTKDEKGGVTLSNPIDIVIHPADVEAVYTVNTPKPIGHYSTSDVLATVMDANGPIVSATVVSGTLPPGLTLNSDGTIKISNTTLLTQGSFPVGIQTIDSNGGTTTSNITLNLTFDDVTAGVAKIVTSNVAQQDGTFKVTYTVRVENLGNVTINNIQVTDNLSSTFASLAYSIATGSTATGSLNINPSFNGNGDKNLLANGSTLAVGATSVITFTAIVNPNGSTSTFNNTATVTTITDDGFITNTDLSDNGNDPDPNGNGNPNEAGENDATPVNFSPNPIIGVAKAVGLPMIQPNNSYVLTYTITVKNFGNVALTGVQVTDNLNNAFPNPSTYSIVGTPSASGSLIPNTAFNGNSDKNLLASGSTLSVGATNTITFAVNVVTNGTVAFHNSATGTANGGSGSYTDASVSGVDPDPNGNGNPSDPGEDGSTLIELIPRMAVGIAKAAGTPQAQVDGSYKVTYSLAVENMGNVIINNIQVTDNISLSFPSPATFSILPGSIATGSLVIDPAFNGSTNTNLLLPSSKLNIGSTHNVVFSVLVNLNGSSGIFSNSAIATAISDDAANTYIDISDDGTDPDPNGNGNPTEAGENDPSIINMTPHPVLGAAKAVGAPALQTNGSFNLTYTVTVKNLGNVLLSNVQVVDDFAAAFPSPATFTITNVTSSNLSVNTDFNGVTDKNLLLAGNTLAASGSEQILISVNIRPNGSSGQFYNSAYATAAGAGSSGSTSDLSMSGLDPDPNNNNNPGDAGEDQPTAVSLILSPVIGVSKIANVKPLSSNSYDVTLKFTVQNLGNTPLTNISVYDQLITIFPSGVTYSIKAAPQATGSLAVNPLYNGSTEINLLNASVSSMPVGAKETITFTINVVPNGITGIFYNAAAAYAFNPDNTISYSDLSTNGLLPDPNGNGNPNDANESISTPIVLQTIPVIGLANNITSIVLQQDGTYNIAFTVTVENFGNEVLKDVVIKSNISLSIPTPAQLAIITSPTATGSLTANAAYDGKTKFDLITGGTLNVDEKQTVSYSINVDPNDVFTTFLHQLTASGIGTTTLTSTTDLSDDGLAPDSDGDGHPDGPNENDPTPITLRSNPLALFTMNVSEPVLQSNCSYAVTYTFTILNNGNTTLTGIKIINDLRTVIPDPSTYEIVSVRGTGTAIVNTSFDGKTNVDVLAPGNSLPVGQTLEVFVTVNVVPNGLLGPFSNTASISAVVPDGVFSRVSGGNDGAPAPTEFTIIPQEIFIPQAFSPNGDGQHDYFEINIICGSTAELSVYNRWGDRVYFSKAYQNDWNGTNNQNSFMSKALPDGAYFYTVKTSIGTEITNFLMIKR